MSTWQDHLHADSLPWLLEEDAEQPGVRYFALRDIVGLPPSDPEVVEAQARVMDTGPVPVILEAQGPEGWWAKPVLPEYGIKYQGTLWQVIFLAQLGAEGDDPRVQAACEYVLSNAIAAHGGFTYSGTPSGEIHCMAGQLSDALINLGRLDDDRLLAALDWQARLVTGDGVDSIDAKGTPRRYFKSSTTGPTFACAMNAGLPCAWGGIKALEAFAAVPVARRTPTVHRAIDEGAQFLLSRDPSIADYPFGYGKKPSASWFRFGYPIGYVTDVLQNLEVLSALGHAQNPRLANALKLVEDKQDASGRWKLEHTYNGKMWVDIEAKGRPSKWVTLRALRVLKAAFGD